MIIFFEEIDESEDETESEESDDESDTEFIESDESDVEEIDNRPVFNVVAGPLTDLQASQVRMFATINSPPSASLRSKGKHPSRDLSVHVLHQI